MLSYIILFILLGIVFCIPKKYFKKYGIFILMFIFAIFFGIRNNVAVDDKNYIEIFSLFSKTLENASISYTNIEMIFKIICRILGVLHLNYKALFLLYSALSFTFLGMFLNKLKLNKKELIIFVVAFIATTFFTYMTVMRQFLGITIALYGMALAIIDKKYKSGIIWIVVSALFHNSTIFMLLLLPLFLDKIKVNYKFEIVTLFIVVILGETGLINKIISLISANLKYGQYAIETTEKAFGGSGILHYLFLGMYVLQCIIIEKNNKLTKEKSSIDTFIQKGEFIYLSLFFATVNSGYAIRVSYLYLIFLCLLFVTFIKEIKNRKIMIGATTIIYVFLIIIIGKNLIGMQDTKFMKNNFSIDFFNQNRID